MRRKRRNKACDAEQKRSQAERRKKRYDPERRRKRYLAERDEAKRRRAAYDRYMLQKQELPDKAWKTDAGKECRTIAIWRHQYSHNYQHMRVLTTGKGVRFRIID